MDWRTSATMLALMLAADGSWTARAADAPVSSPAVEARRDTTVRAVEQVLPSVVNIRTETIIERRDPFEQLLRDFWGPYYRRPTQEKTYSLGSGVIIDEDGWVLTNFHVVNRASRVYIKLSDGRECEAEPIVGTSFTDVALLRIVRKAGEKFTAARFASDDDLLLGETVLALGNPFGLGVSVSRGILSSKSRRPPAENEPLEVEDWLQTDAAINPGSSGGPLINLNGELIGINVAVYREGQGIGFAIPVKRVCAALGEIYSPETVSPDRQKPTMWFGARVRPGALPLVVAYVHPQSPAGNAGLKVGDAILEINDRAPRSFMDFSTQLIDAGDKKDVRLRYARGGEKRTLTLRMVPEQTFFNADLVRQKIGARVQDLTPKLADAFGLRDATGVVVTEVDRNGPASAIGMRQDMLITAADGQVVQNQVMLAKVLHAKKTGERCVLDLIVPRQRGAFLVYVRERGEVTVR